MKKILFLLTFSPFLLAFQCDPEPEPCGEYIEFEKPNLVTAKQFIAKKNFLWNSGMFCFKAGVLLEELKAFQPKVYKKSKKAF